MADEDLPPINVRIGNNNEVGHIGHIVYQKPPPDPNSIFMNGAAIGTISPGAHQPTAQTYLFPKLFLDSPMGIGSQFEVQGVKLRIVSMNSGTRSRLGGRPPKITLWHVLCEIIV